TQCLVLLGELPDPRRLAASVRELLETPAHAGILDLIARLLPQKPAFDELFYHSGEFLDLYFAHYFPPNLGKLQLVLLDLLRAGKFPDQVHLADLGVGTGTSIVAVVDFVLALGAIADLAGVALPLRELSLRGYDRAPACLSYTREVVDALSQVLAGFR